MKIGLETPGKSGNFVSINSNPYIYTFWTQAIKEISFFFEFFNIAYSLMYN